MRSIGLNPTISNKAAPSHPPHHPSFLLRLSPDTDTMQSHAEPTRTDKCRESPHPTDHMPKRPGDQQSKRPTDLRVDRTTDLLTNRPIDPPNNRPTVQPTSRPANLPTNRLADKPPNRPTEPPTNYPSDESTLRPTNQSTDQPSDQPKNQSIISLVPVAYQKLFQKKKKSQKKRLNLLLENPC